MPRHLFKNLIPKKLHFKDHKAMQIFGDLLHDPNLLHLNRNSVAKAFAVGLFAAFIPVPLQMVIAAGLAIMFHANLPISVILVWITNPLTMAPVFYYAYKLGATILQVPIQAKQFHIELSFSYLLSTFLKIWEPLLLGSFIFSCVAAIIGYYGIKIFWRIWVSRTWNLRKKLRLERFKKKTK